MNMLLMSAFVLVLGTNNAKHVEGPVFADEFSCLRVAQANKPTKQFLGKRTSCIEVEVEPTVIINNHSWTPPGQQED